MAKQDGALRGMSAMGQGRNLPSSMDLYRPYYGGGYDRPAQQQAAPQPATPQQQTTPNQPNQGGQAMIQPSQTAMDFINQFLMQYGKPGIARPQPQGSVAPVS